MDMIGKIIKDLRKEIGCTQNKLADILGITQDSVSLWENGKRIPDTQYIIAMAKFFDVSADYLLGLNNEYQNLQIPKEKKLLGLTLDENRLLKNYRAMSEKQKALLEQYIDLIK